MSQNEHDDEATQVLASPDDALAAAIQASKARRAARDEERTETLERLPPRPTPAPPASRPAPRPEPPARDARAFPWGTLRRLSRAELATTRRLTRLLPSDGALETAARALTTLTGAPHTIRLSGVRVHAAPMTASGLAGSFVTRLSMPPDPEAGLLSVDARWVAATLGAMLGEDDATWRSHGAMGARDFGLATYATLRVMDAVSKAHHAPPLVISSSPLSAADLHDPIEGGREVYEVVYTLEAAQERGTARLFLPGHLVAAMEVFVRGAATAAPPWLAGATVRAPVVLGVGALSAPELAGLGVGDVLTLGEHGVTAAGITPRGASRMVLGAARHVALALEVDEGAWIARVGEPTRTTTDETQEEQVEQVEEATGSEAIAVDTPGALLDEATVRVHAVVGEVAMSVAQLAGLKVGEVLELGVAVGAPVELRLTGGEKVGVGELVDVEGTLGVRVRQVGG
jgi:type III secretion system YscQ/HrcQ family protein